MGESFYKLTTEEYYALYPKDKDKEYKIKIPDKQILWLTFKDENSKPIYILTSDKSKREYSLYKVKANGSLGEPKTNEYPIFKELEKLEKWRISSD